MAVKKGTEDIESTISIHALLGTNGCQTMRVVGRIKKQTLVILIDFGRTHNFIDQAVVKKLRYPIKVITGVKVTVANGETLNSQEVCELLLWETQGLS